MMNISRITLNAAVKSQFGITATEMIRQRLIDEIKTAFLFSGKTISELSFDFNFSEPSHLMRFFKKQTGQTFTQFKKDFENGYKL